MKHILRQGYGLDIEHVTPIAEGIENSIYKVVDVRGVSYAFVIFEVVPLALVEAYCRELVVLRSSLTAKGMSGVAVPAGLPTVEQSKHQYCLEIADEATDLVKPGVLQEWILGEHRLPDAKACADLGRFLGVLNQQKPGEEVALPVTGLEDPLAQTNTSIPVNQHLYRIALIEQNLSDYPLEMQTTFHHLKAECKEVLAAHQNFEYGLVHGDLFADNALLDKQGVVGVIDFFNASWAPRLFDLAVCLMDWCVRDDTFDENLTREFVQGFREKCDPVTPIEVQQWPNLVRLAAFRFWCTRQEYYLACRKRGVEPVQNRDPAFCEHVFKQVAQQEHFLVQLWDCE